MKLTVTYISGRVEEYDTGSNFNNSGLFANRAGLTSASLRLDDLSDGLWIEYYYYDVTNPVTLPARSAYGAPEQAGYHFQILDKHFLEGVVTIERDGNLVMFRMGPKDPLINAVKMNNAAALYLGGGNEKSVADTVVDLFRIMRGDEEHLGMVERVEGETDDEYEQRIASSIGWELKPIKDLLKKRKAEEEAMEAEGPAIDYMAGGGDIYDDFED